MGCLRLYSSYRHGPPDLISLGLSVMPSGGCVVFSMNDRILGIPRYPAFVAQLIADGAVELAIKEYGPHLPKRDVKAAVLVLRKR